MSTSLPVIPTDVDGVRRALAVAATARVRAHPNPWVGAVLMTTDGQVFTGATGEPGGLHAEAAAVAAAREAGTDVAGATVFVTLEPCVRFEGKRTPSCAETLRDAGVRRVVVAMLDPDERVSGHGVALLREAGVEVVTDVLRTEAEALLRPYVHHRRTGRPWVLLKMGATLDGRTAAPDGTSQWITGPEARADAHQLRAESDAILVGAGTVRLDDPALDVRHVDGPHPRRIVLGHAPEGAKVHPCTEMSGPLTDVLDTLGAEGVVQLLVEGGAAVAGDFHRQGLVDQYVLYLAPALFGGSDARGLFTGEGAPTMAELWRGEMVDHRRVGADLRVDLLAARTQEEIR
ncbi:bifunctional diaminohydroxyphosphoribosylaminopyrimidine deaminase/5-amino-6-(5-phosphoribosylamino)uracil reductase RibD [Nocardioides yefusunii]|uniref:Riboflavin biosynthesis protein RibD n=1 Tax=Nocardioides yefusunii TaxID=2500546 RepID=A0ABW1QUN9_9ACTN|nr:bifunctional diaminohydroxyphosphoribosylaminopyrimidine deaminase/5-amino-6-(5-phosphoribosylamino)uracil reductase RibD [Nocardioides yefusunii]